MRFQNKSCIDVKEYKTEKELSVKERGSIQIGMASKIGIVPPQIGTIENGIQIND